MNNIELMRDKQRLKERGYIASLILIWTNGLWRSNVFQKEFFLQKQLFGYMDYH